MSNSFFTLKNETIFVIAEASGGVYNTTQLKTICDISEEDSAFLKVTEDERLGFMLPPAKIPEVQTKLAEVGLLLRHYRGQNCASPKACLGELCPKSKQDALGAALELAPLLNEKLQAIKNRIAIGINGCEVACLGSATDDIHLVGCEEGYKIYIGGKANEVAMMAKLICEKVAKEKIGEAIFSILDLYTQSKQEEDEQFSDVLKRIGIEPFITVCAPFGAAALDSAVEPPPGDLALSSRGEPTGDSSLSSRGEPTGDSSLSSRGEPTGDAAGTIPPSPDDALLAMKEEQQNILKIKPKQEISVQIVEKTMAVKLPNGFGFSMPNDSLQEGESMGMQLGEESFLIKNLSGILHIKYGNLELSVPFILLHDKNPHNKT